MAFEYKNNEISMQVELKRFNDAEEQAANLLRNRDQSTTGSAKGFMLASLTFLEKNKVLFPDTYERAKKLCENSGCTETGHSSGYSESDNYQRAYEGASAMHYLIRGIIRSGK